MHFCLTIMTVTSEVDNNEIIFKKWGEIRKLKYYRVVIVCVCVWGGGSPSIAYMYKSELYFIYFEMKQFSSVTTFRTINLSISRIRCMYMTSNFLFQYLKH